MLGVASKKNAHNMQKEDGVCHRDVAGRVTIFQSGKAGSIPNRVRDFNLYFGSACVYFCMLSLVEALTFC